MGTPFKLSLLTVILVFGASFSSVQCAKADFHEGKIQDELKGDWKSQCMDMESGVFIQTTSTFDGAGNSTDKVIFYSDAACSKATEMVKSDSATYKIGKQIDAEGMKAYEMDLTITQWSLEQHGSTLKSGGAVPTQYDIIAVEGDKLYTSGLTRKEKGPILDPAKRPTTLDKQNFFTKQ